MTTREAGRLGWIASKSYRDQRHKSFVEAYYKKPKMCKHCKTIIPFEKRDNDFCSKVCWNKHSTKRTTDECIVCHKKLHKGKKFCSVSCQKDYEFKKFVEESERSGIFPASNSKSSFGEASRFMVRKYLRMKYGYKCAICGISDWNEKPLQLVVDHIDGNALNNSISNFRLLCPNCNSQQATFAGRNRGNGKRKRKEIFG